MTPYYEDGSVTIYHADCRDVQTAADVLVTDPPYPNNAGHFNASIGAAREWLGRWAGWEAIVFWSEMEHPPIRIPLVAVHIWHRTNVNGRPYEPAYHFAVGSEKRRSDVIATAAVFDGVGPGCSEYVGHPTQKGLVVMEALVGRVRKRGVILDPFMGSGTTLVAAKNMGRRAIGIEIEERYCAIAADRCRQEVLPLGAA